MSLIINAYATVNQLTPLDLPYELTNHQTKQDPLLQQHLLGFVDYIVRDQPPATPAIGYLVQHIKRVKHQVSLVIAEESFDQFTVWALRNNCIVFMPDGTLRDPQGDVLFDARQPMMQHAHLPYLLDAYQRRDHNIKKMRHIGLPFINLPPVIGEAELQLKSDVQVAERVLALLLVAIRAESLSINQPISVAQLQHDRPLSFQYLTADERNFMHIEQPTNNDITRFSWRYEAAWVLAWALGWMSYLPKANELCDVSTLAGTILHQSENDFLLHSSLRAADDILHALHLYYRLHHVSRNGLAEQQPLMQIDESVVLERHSALNWLTEFENVGSEWDEIKT